MLALSKRIAPIRRAGAMQQEGAGGKVGSAAEASVIDADGSGRTEI